jgi:opacity protein-like surface antigen
MSFLLSLFLITLYSAASAESVEGKWETGLRLGPSFHVEKHSEYTKGGPGVMGNGNVSYGITERVLLGINIEWEKHEIKNWSTGFYYGDETTVSIIPTIEYHFFAESSFYPYVLLGFGINMNSFSGSSDLVAQCAICRMDPKNTFALKGGGGIDYFITHNLAVNGELDLKMNDGTSDLTGNFPGFSSGNSMGNSACVLSLILGVRYFY